MDYAGDLNHRQGRLALLITLALVSLELCVGIASFGIWDPWELNAADMARRLADGEGTLEGQSLRTWLVASAFRLLGISDWAGRLPIALAGVGTAGLAYALVAHFEGRRAGLYASLVTATSPLFVLNARPMLGEAPAFFAQALLALGVFRLAFVPHGSPGAHAPLRHTLGWVGVAVLGGGLATLASGVLVGVLPVLGALAVCTWSSARHLRAAALQRLPWWLAAGAAFLLAAGVARAIYADRAAFDLWLGGQPAPDDPPAFEHVLALLFHGFAPWSALLPAAMAALWLPVDPAARAGATAEVSSPDAPDHSVKHTLRLFVCVWAVLGFAAHTLYASRYGETTFIPVVAVGVLVALSLRTLERSPRRMMSAGLVCAMLAGLAIRDYALYPETPLGVLGLGDVDLPEGFNPRVIWGAALGVFALAATLALGVAPQHAPLDLGLPYRWLRAQWQRGGGFRVWVGGGLLAAALLVTAGITAGVAPGALGLTTLARKMALAVALLILLVPVAVACMQLVVAGIRRLAGLRAMPLLLAGCGVGIYAAHGFLPALSAQLSPREIYATYNALAAANEPLAEYEVSGRAAAYYAEGEPLEMRNVSELVRFLAHDGRRWAAFPKDALAKVDRAFRKRTQRHLFVVDASSSQVVLATNQALEGRTNENALASSVRREVPEVEHPVGAELDDKIHLVGYDLALPHQTRHGAHVGAGEQFRLTWVFEVRERVPGNYQVFVHIDGNGTRIHGDHDPVDGMYPVRLWEPGDVVIDTQELTVPVSFRPGDYTIYVGFYSGNQRLPVRKGPQDGQDRVRVGVLRIR